MVLRAVLLICDNRQESPMALDEPVRCPKCAHAQRLGDAACPQCGLLRERFAGYVDASEPHPVIDSRFGELSGRWEDEAAHAAFIEEAVRVGALDLAAGHYRRWLAEHPDDPQAKGALERAAALIERLQVTALAADARAQKASVRRALRVALACVVVAFLGVIVFLLRRRGPF
jgi:hypothetical protein